jgi:tetratricopeptide (TPR) repeat protein
VAAAEAYGRAGAASENDPAIMDARAMALLAAGQHQEALDLIDEAIKRSPGNAVLEYHAGLVLAAMGDENKALDSMDEALRLDPELWDALYDIALLLEKTGKRDKAFAVYDEFLEAGDQNKRPQDAKHEHALERYRAIREEIESARKGGGFFKKLFGMK